MCEEDETNTRQTDQADLELDPAAHRPIANVDIAALGIDAANLFEQSVEQTRMAITVVDPHQDDNPIIYANRAFTELTGYARDEIVGRNCRFLQGRGTDPSDIQAIRDVIASREVRVVEVLNYRKDGTAFWNSLHIGPVYNGDGRLTHFYGSQWDITDLVEKRRDLALQVEVAEELQHRTKNLFGVISAIVALSGRGETDVPRLVEKVRDRLVALGKAHSISIAEGEGRSSDLFDLASTILAPYQSEGGDSVVFSGPTVRVPRDAVTPIGLMLHELATNAVKYGALSVADGFVAISWEREGDRLRLTWIEEHGPAVTAPEATGGGTRMTEGVLGAIGATISYDWPPTGLTATLDMPLDD